MAYDLTSEHPMPNRAVQDSYLPNFVSFSDYLFERCALDQDWDDFVRRSPQGTIFSRNAFLSAVPNNLGLWQCKKGNAIKALVLVVETEDGNSTLKLGHIIHTGILFDEVSIGQNLVDRQSDEFTISAFIIRELSSRYKEIHFTTYITFKDLRPFSWHNYGGNGPKIDLEVRYTSLIERHDQEAPPTQEELLARCNARRRRSVRHAEKAGVVVYEHYDEQLLCALFCKTFERQGIVVQPDELSFIRNVANSLNDAGLIRSFVSASADGALGSILVFGIDDERAFYLWGGNDPELAHLNTSSLAFIRVFETLFSQNINSVDLEGINSPERGYFKLSFGGSLAPYHQVHWEGE